LLISYTSANTAVATVAGNRVTIVGAGTTIITATQAGDANYEAATSVAQNLVINKGVQTISFPSISNKVLGDAPITLNATTSSGLPITYSLNTNPSTGVATLSGNVLTLIGIGLINITATQAVNNNFLPANSFTRSFRVETTITQLAHFSKEHLRFFPNPSQNGIKVQFPENILVDNTITTWVDMQGKIVANIFLNPTEQASIFTLEASHLPKGTYFVSIPIDKKAIVQKLITH
jgi:hypothetical protein